MATAAIATEVREERQPIVPITEIEQSAFCRTDETLEAKTLEQEFEAGVRWQKIPISYLKATPEELDVRIGEARAALGEQLVILGHHYQRNEIIKYADLRGDSFKLSQYAASQDSDFIVFLWGPLHGRDGGRPKLAGPEGNAAESDRRLLNGRHGRHRRRARLLGGP